MPHLSHRTISLGVSESSFLHFMQIISVVVSSTVSYTVIGIYTQANHNRAQ
jgi:hypothetical protein